MKKLLFDRSGHLSNGMKVGQASFHQSVWQKLEKIFEKFKTSHIDHAWRDCTPKIISSDLVDFFVESDGEGPRSKSEREDSRTDSEKTARLSFCGVSGATSQSCKVTQAIRNVHDQPESLRRRPAVVNLLGPVELTIPQSQFLGAWHQWRNTGHIFVTWGWLAIFGRLFGRVLVRILTSHFHHRTLQKNSYKTRDYDFGVPFFFFFNAENSFLT